MGREALCVARLGRQRSQGKALLETSDLIFRGDEFRVKVPFKAITAIAAKGTTLTVTWPEGTLALELGADAAPKWAEKIRNPPSRLDKLGVKAESTVAIVGKLESPFVDEVTARAARVERKPPAHPVNLLFLAAETRGDLERLDQLQKMIVPDGAIWVVRRKGSATITESDVLRMGKASGLVDTKVVAFSDTHTAEKLVIPVSRR
ncbi:MAG: hypothetical protein QOI66_1255 [Myxococcales bacterium]|jgi:hypothetical protein|nr:hypothetical protein [Myxococcales bacterium]